MASSPGPSVRGPAIAVGALGAATAAAAVIALGAYAVHPLAPVGAVVLAGFIALALLRPPLAVAGAMAALPLEAVRLPLGGGGVSPTEGMLALVGLCWAARALLRPHDAALPEQRDLPLLFALGAVTAGLLVAPEPATVQRIVMLWALFAAVYLTVRSFTVDEVRLVAAALVVGAGVLGALGAAEFLQSGQTATLAGGGVTQDRAVGTFTDPNYFAAVLVLALFGGLGLAVGDLRRHGWLLLPAAGALAGIAFSLSRGGMLGLATGVLILLLWPRAQRTLGSLALLALVVLAVGAAPTGTAAFEPVAERLSTLDGGSETVRSRRPEIWRVARDVAVDHPIIGVGANQFVHEAAQRGLYERGRVLENAHNLPLSLAAESGILALAAFLVFFAQVIRRGVVALSHPQAFGLKLGLLAAFVGFLVQGLTIASFRPPVVVGTFFVVAGLITALHDRDRRPPGGADPIDEHAERDRER